jgi:hypothetical protein
MRVCIIGNDGIVLRREPPAAVNEGEIAVTSNEEFHIAQLSSKRLLALWNALPGVEKRKKTGDREALIDQLRSAIEGLPDPNQTRKADLRRMQPFRCCVGLRGQWSVRRRARAQKGRARSQGRDTPVSNGVGVAEEAGFEQLVPRKAPGVHSRYRLGFAPTISRCRKSGWR